MPHRVNPHKWRILGKTKTSHLWNPLLARLNTDHNIRGMKIAIFQFICLPFKGNDNSVLRHFVRTVICKAAICEKLLYWKICFYKYWNFFMYWPQGMSYDGVVLQSLQTPPKNLCDKNLQSKEKWQKLLSPRKVMQIVKLKKEITFIHTLNFFYIFQSKKRLG